MACLSVSISMLKLEVNLTLLNFESVRRARKRYSYIPLVKDAYELTEIKIP